MKSTDIKTGHTYEVTAGRNKTKIKVVKFNAKTGSWECETVSGKSIAIKDAKRFLAEVGKKHQRFKIRPIKPKRKPSKINRSKSALHGPTVKSPVSKRL